MSGGSKQPSTTTTVNQTALPAFAQPAGQQLLNIGTSYASRPYTQNPYSYSAPISQYTTQGLDMITNRARSGSPVMSSMNTNLQDTLSGKYLSPDSNPFLSANVNRAMGDVQSRVNAQFNRPGGYGSTAHQELMTRNLGDIANQMYGQNYDQERQRQMQAMLFAPQAAQSDYYDASQLMSAGDIQRQMEQEGIDKNYSNWQTAYDYPLAQMNALSEAIRGSTGGGMTSSSTGPNPNQPNRFANALGGASALGGLGGSFLGPWGAVGGALLGGLGGLL